MVLPAFRRKGGGRRLLESVEGKARELGCCKLTLEVMDNNDRALRAYEAAGFVRYSLQENDSAAIFLSKPLD
jgi:ribosomal protein S18 acetylase RimI-like enzyme